MATVESNQMRRAHRVNIPLIIVIDKKAYQSKDWSMTGAGIDDLDIKLEINDVIDASIVLALQEAKIEMPIKLKYKVQRGSVSGFEFEQISEKNKKVLREFLELSIEGKLDHVDGLLNIYNEPIIDTPIKESVVLSDEEESVLKQAFLKRSNFYIKAGIVFLILLFSTIYYNTSYVYRSIGTVSGNFIKISSGVTGKISKIHVKVGDTVRPKELLFELDDTMILSKIDILERKLADLRLIGGNTKNTTQRNHQILNILKRDMDKTYASYSSAKKLYKNRIISISNLQRVEAIYSKAKVKYLQEKNKVKENQNKASGSLSVISLITQFELQREELINALNYLRIFSETSGRVYAIKSYEGNYIGSSDEAIVLETNQSSFVVCKLKQEESLNIRNGMTVKIYSSRTDQTYSGTIQTIGNLSLNTQSEITNEVSLKEVTVKIVFNDKTLILPLNERVKVWFYRPIF